MVRSTAVLVLLLASVASGGDKDGPPVAIFVQEGVSKVADEAAEKAMNKQLGTPAAEAGQAWTDEHIALLRKHGKKRAAWPADAQRQYEEGRARAARTEFDHLYLATPQKELADSASDLRKKLEDEKFTPLAQGREAAVWVVTPVGRYNYQMWWCPVLDIAPGGSADPAAALAALTKVHEAYRANLPETLTAMQAVGFSGSYHVPTEQEPRLLLGNCGQGMRWKAAAAAMEWQVKELAKAYNEAKRPAN